MIALVSTSGKHGANLSQCHPLQKNGDDLCPQWVFDFLQPSLTLEAAVDIRVQITIEVLAFIAQVDSIHRMAIPFFWLGKEKFLDIQLRPAREQ